MADNQCIYQSTRPIPVVFTYSKLDRINPQHTRQPPASPIWTNHAPMTNQWLINQQIDTTQTYTRPTIVITTSNHLPTSALPVAPPCNFKSTTAVCLPPRHNWHQTVVLSAYGKWHTHSSIAFNSCKQNHISEAMLQLPLNQIVCLLYTSPSPRD